MGAHHKDVSHPASSSLYLSGNFRPLPAPYACLESLTFSSASSSLLGIVLAGHRPDDPKPLFVSPTQIQISIPNFCKSKKNSGRFSRFSDRRDAVLVFMPAGSIRASAGTTWIRAPVQTHGPDWEASSMHQSEARHDLCEQRDGSCAVQIVHAKEHAKRRYQW
jgi:hypothetical protein